MSAPAYPTRIRSYRDLVAWQRSMQLAVATYRACAELAQRQPLLRDQMVRAAISIPANVAEGSGRLSKADNVRHLLIARGSLRELETLLLLATELGLVEEESGTTAMGLADEVGRLITALVRKLGTRTLL